MTGIVRLEEGDFALGLLLRNLAEDVLGEVVLELAERSHAIVDPIEQQQDGDAGEGAEAKTDQQALDQAGAHGDRRRSPFP